MAKYINKYLDKMPKPKNNPKNKKSIALSYFIHLQVKYVHKAQNGN